MAKIRKLVDKDFKEDFINTMIWEPQIMHCDQVPPVWREQEKRP